jgi:hypothetical protein
MWSVLIIILGSDFVDFLEVVLLFCGPSLGCLCGLGWRLIFFFLFLVLIEVPLFFILIVFFDGSFGSLAIRCDRRDRLSYRLCRRSLCIGSGLGLALLAGGRSVCLLLVHTPSIIVIPVMRNKGVEINPA